MTALDAQQRVIELQQKLAEAQVSAAELEVTELTPHADEVILAYMDAGEAAIGAVQGILDSVGAFLQGLGDGA